MTKGQPARWKAECRMQNALSFVVVVDIVRQNTHKIIVPPAKQRCFACRSFAQLGSAGNNRQWAARRGARSAVSLKTSKAENRRDRPLGMGARPSANSKVTVGRSRERSRTTENTISGRHSDVLFSRPASTAGKGTQYFTCCERPSSLCLH